MLHLDFLHFLRNCICIPNSWGIVFSNLKSRRQPRVFCRRCHHSVLLHFEWCFRDSFALWSFSKDNLRFQKNYKTLNCIQDLSDQDFLFQKSQIKLLEFFEYSRDLSRFHLSRNLSSSLIWSALNKVGQHSQWYRKRSACILFLSDSTFVDFWFGLVTQAIWSIDFHWSQQQKSLYSLDLAILQFTE